MLLFTHSTARELGEALIEASDTITGDLALEAVTLEKFGSKFVVIVNDECNDSTWAAITREEDTEASPNLRIAQAPKFGNARG